MQVAIFSDTHSEFQPWIAPKIPGVDVIIVAGDLGSKQAHYAKSLKRLREVNPQAEVITVLGNHEFYGGVPLNKRGCYHESAKRLGVSLLDNSSVTIKGWTFVGGTLWTDIAARPAAPYASNMLNDYRYIMLTDGYGDERPIDVKDVSREHQRTLAVIKPTTRALSRTVVVTHHAPSRRSRMLGTDVRMDDFYCNTFDGWLEDDIPFKPAAWIHGHIHQSNDYMIGETRVICNPRGYLPNMPNPEFLPYGARLELPTSV